MKKLIAWVCVLTAILTFACGCGSGKLSRNSFVDGLIAPQISAEKIEEIHLWYTGGSKDFTRAEIEEFVALFNDATVKLKNGGTTPDFGVSVKMTDGTVFQVNDSEGDLVEICFRNGGEPYIYLVSEELQRYLKEMTLPPETET